MLADSFKFTSELDSYYTVRDIGKMMWYGDQEASIESYCIDINLLFEDIPWPESQKRDLVITHMQDAARGVKCHTLKNALERYLEGRDYGLEAEHRDFTYERLMAIIARYRDNKIRNKNLINRDKLADEQALQRLKEHQPQMYKKEMEKRGTAAPATTKQQQQNPAKETRFQDAPPTAENPARTKNQLRRDKSKERKAAGAAMPATEQKGKGKGTKGQAKAEARGTPPTTKPGHKPETAETATYKEVRAMKGSRDEKSPCLHFLAKGVCANQDAATNPCRFSHDMSQFTYTQLQASHVKGELARMLHNRTLKGGGKGKGDGAKGGKGDTGGKAGKGKVLDENGQRVPC